MSHLMLQHKRFDIVTYAPESNLSHYPHSITTLQGEDIVFLATDINLSGAVDWVMIQSCYSVRSFPALPVHID